jgi:hypothetical protein
MVFCYECEVLFGDLANLGCKTYDINHFDHERPIFACLGCGFGFEYDFMANRGYDVPHEDWLQAGLGALLRLQRPT